MGREEQYPPTPEMLNSANTLLSRVEGLFYDLGVDLSDEDQSSGYRPGHFNVAAGGSKKSSHTTCEAIDLKDAKGRLKAKVLEAPHLLEKWGLYMEDPNYTKTWLHLQTRKTKNRIFKPY